jgi:hypothetical protein
MCFAGLATTPAPRAPPAKPHAHRPCPRAAAPPGFVARVQGCPPLARLNPPLRRLLQLGYDPKSFYEALEAEDEEAGRPGAADADAAAAAPLLALPAPAGCAPAAAHAAATPPAAATPAAASAVASPAPPADDLPIADPPSAGDTAQHRRPLAELAAMLPAWRKALQDLTMEERVRIFCPRGDDGLPGVGGLLAGASGMLNSSLAEDASLAGRALTWADIMPPSLSRPPPAWLPSRCAARRGPAPPRCRGRPPAAGQSCA